MLIFKVFRFAEISCPIIQTEINHGSTKKPCVNAYAGVVLYYESINDLHFGRQRFFRMPLLSTQSYFGRNFNQMREASAYYCHTDESFLVGATDESMKEYFLSTGEHVVFSGFPVKKGCGSAIINRLSFEIPESGHKADLAWVFLKYTLSDAFQEGEIQYRYTTVPVKKSVFEYDTDRLIAYEDAPDPLQAGGLGMIDHITGESYTCHYPALQVWMRDSFYKLLEDITTLDEADSKIEEIILEEVTRCANEECSAKQAAEMIVNRVALYAMEKKQ